MRSDSDRRAPQHQQEAANNRNARPGLVRGLATKTAGRQRNNQGTTELRHRRGHQTMREAVKMPVNHKPTAPTLAAPTLATPPHAE
jgi:hypothetical protein